MGPAVMQRPEPSREQQQRKRTRKDFFSPNQNSTRGTQRMEGPRESVRRSLFGPVDHDQLRRDLALKLREFAEQDSRRWNFNFQTETPLAGRFQWDGTPADGVCSREDSAGTDQENRSSVSNTRTRPAEATAARRKRSLSKPAAKPGSNARITDFFAKRRRTTETKSILNTFHTSSSEAALCKTLR